MSPKDGEKVDESQPDVSVRHEEAEDYTLEPATGTYGGLQPNDNFKIDFTLDHNPRTLKEGFKHIDGETVLTSIETEQEIVREHRVGVTMSATDAFYSGCWIIAQFLEGESPEDIQALIASEYDFGETEKEEEE